MKLTKVLVGLVAISLCGMAIAGVKKGMSSADMRAGFLTAVKKGDEASAIEFIRALAERRDWDYYKTYITGDLKAMRDGDALIAKYIAVIPAKKDVVPPTKKDEVPTPKKDEGKKEGWQAAWGTEPKAWDAATLNDYANYASLYADEATLDADGKIWAAKIVYAHQNNLFAPLAADPDLKDTVKVFGQDASKIASRK